MTDPPTGNEMLERFRQSLAKLVRVPKDEVLRLERAQKEKRRRQRTSVATRPKAG